MEINSLHTIRNLSYDSLLLLVKYLSNILNLLEISADDFSNLDDHAKKIIELYSYCFDLIVERWKK